MIATQTGELKTLPDPQTEFVFTVSGDGWAAALLLVALATLAVRVFLWRRRRARRK